MGGPRPPENPLARLIADTPDVPMLPSRETVIARQETASREKLRRYRNGKSGYEAMVIAIRKAS